MWRPFLLLTWSLISGAAPQVSYWFPITPQLSKPITPLRPIRAPRQVLVWNQFGQGHFGSVLIEFEEMGNTGRFKRVGQQRAYTLDHWRVNEGQQFCDMILGNSVMRRVDHASFVQMGGIDYFPKEPGAYTHHLESAHGLHQNQLTYLEVTSWMLAAELKAIFGVIPWDLVVEVKAQPGLTADELRAQVEKKPGDFTVRVRRATLRLVAGQFLDWGAEPSTTFRLENTLLPLERGPGARPQVPRWETPFVFELGRASQIDGLIGESEILVPFALAVANHTRHLFHPYPSSYLPMPPETAAVHVLSLDKAHTVLFRRKLNLEIEAQFGGEAWLANRLPALVDKQPFGKRLNSIAAIHEAVPGRYTEWGAFTLLMSYRSSFRRDFDLTGMTGYRPLVFRTYAREMHKRVTRGIVDVPEKPISDADFERLWNALETAGTLELPKFDHHHDYDVGQQDWKGVYGIEPLVISNFEPLLTRDPQYLLKTLLAMSGNWRREWMGEALFASVPIAVAVKDSSVEQQAVTLGLKRQLPLPGQSGLGTVFVLTFPELEALKTRNPGLFEAATKEGPYYSGFWERYLMMSALPGL